MSESKIVEVQFIKSMQFGQSRAERVRTVNGWQVLRRDWALDIVSPKDPRHVYEVPMTAVAGIKRERVVVSVPAPTGTPPEPTKKAKGRGRKRRT